MLYFLRARTIAAVLSISIPLIGSAMAEMTVASMASATNAARNAAQAAVQYEICGVNSNDVLVALLNKANACNASQSQQAQLQNTYNQELASHKSTLQQQNAKCQWSLTEAQRNFDSMLSKLKQNIAAGGC
jgi:hypothetical protein